MYAVVGLGNPGSRYEKTRHNAGFWTIASLAGPAGSFIEKFGCRYTSAEIAGEKTVLAMPQQYMNESGSPTSQLLSFFKIPRDKLIVVHDELDLRPGQVRVKQGGSAGGNRGVADLIQKLGGKDFFRVRIGIGHPRTEFPEEDARRQMDPASWVLQEPSSKDWPILERAVHDASDCVRLLISSGLEEAQRTFNRKQSTAAN